MAITGLNCCITGATQNFFVYKVIYNPYTVANYFYSSWYQPGVPSQAILDTRYSGYTFDTTTGGDLQYQTIPFVQPPPGKNTYLGPTSLQPLNGNATVYFCDRIWQSSGLPISGQSGGPRYQLNTPVWPARDFTGGSNGLDYMVGFEILDNSDGPSNNKGNGPFFTYTNTDGVSNRTGVFQIMVFHSQQYARRGHFHVSTLQHGDRGVKSIQEVWFSGAWQIAHQGSGQIVVYRPIDVCEYITPSDNGTPRGSSNSVIAKTKPILYSGTTPFLIACPKDTPTANQTGFLFGQYNYIVT